jgi:hypothetical protein
VDLPVDRQAAAVARLYSAAEERLRRLALEALASGNLGTARYRQVRLAAIQQELAALQAQAVPEATQVLASAYRLGVDIGGGISGAFGTGIHADAVTILADNLVNRLNDAAEHVGRQVDDVFRQEGLRLSAMHLLEGSARREASKQLQESLAGKGIKSFTDRAGHEWGLSTYSEMVIRTTTREAVSVATRNRMLEGGNDLVQISSHVHESDMCDRYDGKVFSLTGATEGYKVLDRLPPLHPRCKHVLSPASANRDQLERDLGLVAV